MSSCLDVASRLGVSEFKRTGSVIVFLRIFCIKKVQKVTPVDSLNLADLVDRSVSRRGAGRRKGRALVAVLPIEVEMSAQGFMLVHPSGLDLSSPAPRFRSAGCPVASFVGPAA